MKILLIAHTNNRENGLGNVTHSHCLELQKRGVDFLLLLPKDEPRHDYTTYPVEYVLPSYIFDLKTKKILDYILFDYHVDADVIHSITEFPHAIIAARLAKKYNKPLVIQAHGTYAVKPLLQFPDKYFLTWAYSKAKLVTPISAFTRDMIQKYSRTKTPMKIIHPGVDFAHFDVQAQAESIQKKYGNKKIILTVGVLKPRKGHDVVLKALGILKKERDNFHYVIVGSDNEGRSTYYESLRTLIQKNNLENNVSFAGTVDDTELINHFHAAYLYIHTPRVINMNFEGFGIVYLEAGACRKPVIAADSGGIRDAVIDGKTGIIVPENEPHATADAVKKLLDDQTLAQKMGDAGYEYAKKHGWEAMAEEYLKVYKSLL